MSEDPNLEREQDPDPLKHSDAERVTSEQAERVPQAEEAEPRDERSGPEDP